MALMYTMINVQVQDYYPVFALYIQSMPFCHAEMTIGRRQLMVAANSIQISSTACKHVSRLK